VTAGADRRRRSRRARQRRRLTVNQAGETDPLTEQSWQSRDSVPSRVYPSVHPRRGSRKEQPMKRRHTGTLAALGMLGVLCGTILSARAQQGPPPPRTSFRPLYAAAAPVRTPESLSSVALPNTTIDAV